MLNDQNVSQTTKNQQPSNFNYNVSHTSSQTSSVPPHLEPIRSHDNANYFASMSNINVNIPSTSNIQQHSFQSSSRKKRITLVDSDEDDIDIHSTK